MELASSIVVEDVDAMRKRGFASLVSFDCDSEDGNKKNLRRLVSVISACSAL